MKTVKIKNTLFPLLFLPVVLTFSSCRKEKAFVLVETVKREHLKKEIGDRNCESTPDAAVCIALQQELAEVDEADRQGQIAFDLVCNDPPCERGEEPQSLPLEETCIGYVDRGQSVRIKFFRGEQLVGICGEPRDVLARKKASNTNQAFKICCMRPVGESDAEGTGEIIIEVEEIFPGTPPRVYRTKLTNSMIVL